MINTHKLELPVLNIHEVLLYASRNGKKTFTLLQSEWPKLYGVLAILSAKGLMHCICSAQNFFCTFAGMVAALDDSVGYVEKALKDAGMLDNCVIVFTTDNGGPANGYDYNAANNFPLR